MSSLGGCYNFLLIFAIERKPEAKRNKVAGSGTVVVVILSTSNMGAELVNKWGISLSTPKMIA
jgi:hypothetical protein